ncbi:MAG: hypothetical protein JF614_27100 [Acidobacteria bacterium]|nr:hypothetical protein [Acidobacteriota bacterium]
MIILGGLICLIAAIWLVILAFRTSILWGLAAFFIPFGYLIFAFTHWNKARPGFMTFLAGFALILVGVAIRS